MRTKYKPWAKPYLEEHVEVMCPFDKLNDYKDYYLEIGSGKGQFLLEMAKKYPRITFIGVEMNVTCAGFTAKKLVENGINNAKLVCANAQVMTPTIKDESVEGIFLNFSDPWPKKRHAERRLTSNTFLKRYESIFKNDYEIVMKTDNVNLFEFSLETLSQNGYSFLKVSLDLHNSDVVDNIMTEYEKKFTEKGIKINYLVAKNCLIDKKMLK